MQFAVLVFALLTGTAVPAQPQELARPSGENLRVEVVIPQEGKPPEDWLKRLSGVVSQEKFTESVFLLIATAIITGIAVPLIKGPMDIRYFKKQKIHEASLARQSKIIDEQERFLSEFIDAVWGLHFSHLQVVYSLSPHQSEEQIVQTWDKFTTDSWQHILRLRKCISSSIHLVDHEMHAALMDLYDRIIDMDSGLLARYHRFKNPSQEYLEIKDGHWEEYYNWLHGEWPKELDKSVATLAASMNLVTEGWGPFPLTGATHPPSYR